MYHRIIDIENHFDEGMFLFGARQVGKSTLLKERFPEAVYFDLLDLELRKRLSQSPGLLKDMLLRFPAGTLVIIDEVQKTPDLLDVVHSLMVERDLHFILSGSSARKLRKRGANNLGGRAIPESLFPLVSAEIPDFDLSRAVNNGLIPRHYAVENAWNRIKGYVELYLKEEILEEAAVRKVSDFERFMEVAAICDGEIINYENIATDCGVSANSIKAYFQILFDSLIGFEIPAFRKSVKRRLFQSPKFYYFDVGIVNYLLGRRSIHPGTPEYGHAFEHLVVQEIVARIGYSGSEEKVSYWHTYDGNEVDIVLGDARVAIEIKSAEEVLTKHLKGLKRFADEFPDARLIIVSRDRLTRVTDGIEMYYVNDFLKVLWEGKI